MSRNPSKIKCGRFCSVCGVGEGSNPYISEGRSHGSGLPGYKANSGLGVRATEENHFCQHSGPGCFSCQKRIVAPTLPGDCRFGDQTFGTRFLERVCCMRSMFLPRSCLQIDFRQKTTGNFEMKFKEFQQQGTDNFLPTSKTAEKTKTFGQKPHSKKLAEDSSLRQFLNHLN